MSDFNSTLRDPRDYLDTEPRPGQRCHACARKIPGTALEYWLERHDLSFETLAQQITGFPSVADGLRASTRQRGPHPRCISKNLIWRLNHQAPGWRPRPTEISSLVQAAILKITGLRVEDLQNRAGTGHYMLGRYLETDEQAKPTSQTT